MTETKKILSEMIRKPIFQLIDGEFEVYEDQDSNSPVGKAKLTKGYIESLEIKSDVSEAYHGQILNKLLRAIAEDADKYNSNLSINIGKEYGLRMKRYLERFGFKETQRGIFKRTSGSSIPPSVMF